MKPFLVFYDIENDALRQKLANYLLSIGLERIQYSVFVGSLSAQTHDLLTNKTKNILASSSKNNYSFVILPLSKTALKNALFFGIAHTQITDILNPPNTLII